VEINPQDAHALGIESHDKVTIESRRGVVRAHAVVTPTVPPGQVFLPMHYVETNVLTDAVFDPYSKQPAYKSCAVCIGKTSAST
jgi:assimilatory nitrate reductase catalytic subunit